MELRQLRYFVVVAEELHFGRAAGRLHIVQSAVSQQIRRLERELGTELLDRSPRHVRLTAAGERFLPAAREVLAAEERARAAVAEGPGRPVLRLGTSSGLGGHLDRILAAFAELAPDVAVELVSAPTRERLERVARRQLDASFVHGDATDVGDAAVPGLRTVPLWPDPLVAVVPAHHPLAGGPDVAIADLAPLRLVLTGRANNPGLVDLVVGACHDAGFEPRPGPGTGSLQDTLASIGASGSAEDSLWTVVYASHARVLRPARVAFRPFRPPGLFRTAGLAVHREHPPACLDLLVKACDLDP